jgi:hypothetical protein
MQMRDAYLLVTVQLLLTAAGLAGSWWVMQLPDVDVTHRKILKWQPADSFSVVASADAPNQTTLSEAITRPLFRSNRKPFDPTPPAPEPAPVLPQPEPVAVATPAPPPPDTSQLILKGLALNAGKLQALIATPEKPDGEWYAVGAEILGWKIIGLDANTVSLAFNDQKATLSLYVDNLTKAVGSP